MNGAERTESREVGANILIARLLRTGILVAVAMLLVGVILGAAERGTPVPDRASIADMPRAVWHLEAGGFFSLGLLVLIITPAARVLALGLVFVRQRLWLLAGFSLLVLAVLALSGVLGLRAG